MVELVHYSVNIGMLVMSRFTSNIQMIDHSDLTLFPPVQLLRYTRFLLFIGNHQV